MWSSVGFTTYLRWREIIIGKIIGAICPLSEKKNIVFSMVQQVKETRLFVCFNTHIYILQTSVYLKLKYKNSFGKSENLSKIFFAEILVFDNDYEGKSLSSNGLL